MSHKSLLHADPRPLRKTIPVRPHDSSASVEWRRAGFLRRTRELQAVSCLSDFPA
ncbi:hypothetical protein E2C01_086116 [Portunus trituberculatus]|uniref:Uncharacterized protein n=1 Tax=Portunus trituberculatus TaxID=210409 RepID=A0A5B7IZX4_PORTR|nr:hypothetical protein [Portunus trituberculatus]